MNSTYEERLLKQSLVRTAALEYFQEVSRHGEITPEGLERARQTTFLGRNCSAEMEEAYWAIYHDKGDSSSIEDDDDISEDDDLPFDPSIEPPIEPELEPQVDQPSREGILAIKQRLGRASFKIAATYHAQKKYHLAVEVYTEVVRYLTGHRYPFLGLDGSKVAVEIYGDLSLADCILLMDCCQGLADCGFNQPHEARFIALDWLYEKQVIAKNLWYRGEASNNPHEWEQIQGRTPPIIATRTIHCLIKQARVFQVLGNTASYQYYIALCGLYFCSLPPNLPEELAFHMNLPFFLSVLEQRDQIMDSRHPDPFCDQRFNIISPAYQLRGAWRKVSTTVDESLSCRTTGSAFIWNGYLYTATGKSKDGKQRIVVPLDLRRLHLTRLDKWEVVVKFPPHRGEGIISQMPIYKDKLYIFWGHPVVDVLDLRTNKWTPMKTTFKPNAADRRAGVCAWPWSRNSATSTMQQTAHDRLFVFGGLNMRNLNGSNLFMELNLKTSKWRRLSGLPWLTEQSDPHEPGPRHSGGSWFSKDKKKFYVFSGVCEKQRPMWEMKYGPSEPWVYDDMWSWDIEGEKWSQERMMGNRPAPRMSMGCVFSLKLEKAIIFGGANPLCPTIAGGSTVGGASFYADTFIYHPANDQPHGSPSRQLNAEPDMSSARWKQIQTCGFPTYRCEHCLVEDPDTGYIYLFGGEVRGETIPTKNLTEIQRRKRATYETTMAEGLSAVPQLAEAFGFGDVFGKSLTRYFTDVWKLHIDIPGGDFECIDMEDELRTAPLGPWQRCFDCRKVGFWKKCGGTCDGKAFFCSVNCQAKGWKTHKEFHGCKKV